MLQRWCARHHPIPRQLSPAARHPRTQKHAPGGGLCPPSAACNTAVNRQRTNLPIPELLDLGFRSAILGFMRRESLVEEYFSTKYLPRSVLVCLFEAAMFPNFEPGVAATFEEAKHQGLNSSSIYSVVVLVPWSIEEAISTFSNSSPHEAMRPVSNSSVVRLSAAKAESAAGKPHVVQRRPQGW